MNLDLLIIEHMIAMQDLQRRVSNCEFLDDDFLSESNVIAAGFGSDYLVTGEGIDCSTDENYDKYEFDTIFFRLSDCKTVEDYIASFQQIRSGLQLVKNRANLTHRALKQ